MIGKLTPVFTFAQLTKTGITANVSKLPGAKSRNSMSSHVRYAIGASKYRETLPDRNSKMFRPGLTRFLTFRFSLKKRH